MGGLSELENHTTGTCQPNGRQTDCQLLSQITTERKEKRSKKDSEESNNTNKKEEQKTQIRLRFVWDKEYSVHASVLQRTPYIQKP